MGLMMGVGAAKTGSFLMRLGIEEEEEELPSLAKATGRVGFLREAWAGERVRQLLMEAVDISQWASFSFCLPFILLCY